MDNREKLRIYFDPNSLTVDGWCYVLRHEDRPLGDAAKELDLYEGKPVILYYSDPGEESEYDAVLSFRAGSPVVEGQWMARLDEKTFRRIRG